MGNIPQTVSRVPCLVRPDTEPQDERHAAHATDPQKLLDQLAREIRAIPAESRPDNYTFQLSEDLVHRIGETDSETGKTFVRHEYPYKKVLNCRAKTERNTSIGQGSNWSLYGARVLFTCETELFEPGGELIEICNERYELKNLFMYPDGNHEPPANVPLKAKAYQEPEVSMTCSVPR